MRPHRESNVSLSSLDRTRSHGAGKLPSERPRLPGIVFCIFDSSAGSCIEHQSLFDTSDISLGGFDHIRVDGYVVDTALDEEFGEVWVYGRSLAADGDSLAVFVCGLDQVADSSLDREVSFIEEGRNGVIVSVAAEYQHGEIVGADGVAIHEFIEFICQNDVGRDLCHEEELEVRTSFQTFFLHDGGDLARFIDGSAEWDHAVQVLQSEFFTDLLDCLEFETESVGVGRVVVTGSTSPAEQVSRFYRFILVAALEVSVFAGLEVGETENDRTWSQRAADLGNAFSEHVDDFSGLPCSMR